MKRRLSRVVSRNFIPTFGNPLEDFLSGFRLSDGPVNRRSDGLRRPTPYSTRCQTAFPNRFLDIDRGKIHGMSRRIGLVGCVKKKKGLAAPARDLYISTLFRGRRSYVEQSCSEWWILSAEHGLVSPDQVLAPYDVTLKDLGSPERRYWSRRVLVDLKLQASPVSGDVVEIHAGSEYRDFGLVQGLQRLGCLVEIPTQGLRFGHQLRFYSEQSREQRGRG